MPNVLLLDGKKIPFEKSISGFELVKKISKSLEKSALIMSVNGELKDLSYEVKSDSQIKIITSITVASKNDVNKYKDYSKISDIILFDSKGYHKSESFDHNLLDEVPDELNKMIAGNIQIDDIPSFKNKDFIIDLSGALEDENGKKDIDKIDNLLNTVHNTNY